MSAPATPERQKTVEHLRTSDREGPGMTYERTLESELRRAITRGLSELTLDLTANGQWVASARDATGASWLMFAGSNPAETLLAVLTPEARTYLSLCRALEKAARARGSPGDRSSTAPRRDIDRNARRTSAPRKRTPKEQEAWLLRPSHNRRHFAIGPLDRLLEVLGDGKPRGLTWNKVATRCGYANAQIARRAAVKRGLWPKPPSVDDL